MAETQSTLVGRVWCCCAHYPLTPGPAVSTTVAVNGHEDVWFVFLRKGRGGGGGGLALRTKDPCKSRAYLVAWLRELSATR